MDSMDIHSNSIRSNARSSTFASTLTALEMSSIHLPLPPYTARPARQMSMDSVDPLYRPRRRVSEPLGNTTPIYTPSTPEIRHGHSRACEAAHRMNCKHRGCLAPVRSLFVDLGRFMMNTGVEWLCMMLFGGPAIALTWFSYPVLDRVFPLASKDGTLYVPELAYPEHEPIFSPAAAGALAALIPIGTFLLCQVYYRSFFDFAYATLGLGYSLVTGTLVQVILKKHIGGLRPHFLDVCQPRLPVKTEELPGVGFQNVMYNVSICTTGITWKVRNAMESFPSGHAAIAFAGFGYLAVYLFAHLRISRQNISGRVNEHLPEETDYERNDREIREWLESRQDILIFKYAKMVALVAPLTFATYLSSTLVLGYQHHAHDVIAGGLIGMSSAVLGYRLAFQGLINWPWNCMPATRLPFSWNRRSPKDEEVESDRV